MPAGTPALESKLAHLPDQPGVYLFKDKAGDILYIGKAAVLADRVRLQLAGSPSALADVTPAAVAELDLEVGREVWLSAKATEVEAYADQGPG